MRKIGFLLLMIGIVFTLWQPLTNSSQIVNAQEDETAKTPQQLCEEALPEITEPESRQFEAPEDVLESGTDYRAIFCTAKGAVYIDLFEEYAPATVNNFVFLAQNNFYNNTTFHRVIEGFMAQGGDPTGTGTGGPGYQFGDEFIPPMTFWREGFLAMANAGPGTNGSQFFITRAPTEHLNQRHTIFGTVLEGQDVVNNLTDREPPQLPDQEVPEADALNTVLIITEPSRVDSSYSMPTSPSADAIYEVLTNVELEGYSVAEAESGVVTADNLDAVENESLRGFYADNNFASRAQILWQINECPTAEPQLLALGFSATDWQTRTNALDALNSEDFAAAFEADAFSVDPLGEEVSEFVPQGFAGVLYPSDLMLSYSTSDYCDTEATYYRYIWQRDQFTMALDFVLRDGDVTPEEVPQLTAFYAYTLELTPAPQVGIINTLLPDVVQSP